MLSFASFEHPTIAGFWAFCQERESIRKKKGSGMPFPWTEDDLLQRYFFCNVRREYDRGTLWYVDNVAKGKRNPLMLGEHPEDRDLLWKTILYRAVNNVKFFESIGGVFGDQDWLERRDGLWEKIQNDAPLPSNPAYIVLQGPDGAGRQEHLLELLEWLEKNIGHLTDDIGSASTLRDVWKTLQIVPYVGPFIALQVYRDLILVDALPFSDDDFTYLGPGARTGLTLFGFNKYQAQYLALQEIQKAHPPDLELNLGDMEQAMCEYRKYCRLRKGEGRHRYYHVATD